MTRARIQFMEELIIDKVKCAILKMIHLEISYSLVFSR